MSAGAIMVVNYSIEQGDGADYVLRMHYGGSSQRLLCFLLLAIVCIVVLLWYQRLLWGLGPQRTYHQQMMYTSSVA
jgi:hypothetical protein